MKPKQPRDAGEEMNVRKVHGALWRELAEPREQARRVPWFLKHFFVMLVILAIIYLAIQNYNWNEYEVNPRLRQQRDLQLHGQEIPSPPAIPAAAQPADAPPPPTPAAPP